MKRSVKRRLLSLLVRQNTLAYDVLHWQTATLKKEMLKAIAGIIAIGIAGGIVTGICLILSEGPLWLTYVCIACGYILCLTGLQPLIHRVWLMQKERRRREQPVDNTHRQ
jgi:hypothetical protein